MATVPYALYAEKSEALYLALLPNINGMAPPIRFENPDGSYGPWVDLKGAQGNSVTV